MCGRFISTNVFKYRVYLVYLLLLINVRRKNQRGHSSNELFLKSDKLIPLDMAEAREDLFCFSNKLQQLDVHNSAHNT